MATRGWRESGPSSLTGVTAAAQESCRSCNALAEPSGSSFCITSPHRSTSGTAAAAHCTEQPSSSSLHTEAMPSIESKSALIFAQAEGTRGGAGGIVGAWARTDTSSADSASSANSGSGPPMVTICPPASPSFSSETVDECEI